MTITANELKTKGVSSLDNTIKSNGCAIITVHGKDKYAVLRISDYNKLRELELDLAIKETLDAVKDDKVYSDGIRRTHEKGSEWLKLFLQRAMKKKCGDF